MTFLKDDALTQIAFSVFENKGVYAVLLGSGMSRSADIPTGWEITIDLIRRVAAARDVPPQPDWAQWYRDEVGEEPNYSRLLEALATSPEERRSILHSYIEPTADDREQGRKLPTVAHQAIAKLVAAGYVRVILTTNFDRLMENALREAGVEPTIVSSVDSMSGAEPLTHSQCYLVKLHGDYKDSRILNTDQELEAYPREYDLLLDRVFDEHGLIVCGWSGDWDHALRSAMLRAPSRRYSVFWATRGSISESATQLVEQRRARTFQIIGADEFFVSLQRSVDTLEQTRRKRPESLELLVASAKKYLAKPEFRISLDDLVTGETESLLSSSDAPEFALERPWDEASFRLTVGRYEGLVEPFARVAGVLGRWGDGSELPMMQEAVRALHHSAYQQRNGVVVWAQLRAYPAVLLMTAYGIGLTRAERWRALHTFMTTTLASDRDDAKSIVSELFLWAWDLGQDKVLWQKLEGLENHKTPLSDHLLQVMNSWKSSFVGTVPDFELLYERFESLASLAHFERNSEESLEEAVKGQEHLAWMPVGRSGWHSQNCLKLIREFESEPRELELVSSGFASGSRRKLKLYLINLQRLASRMRW